MRRVLLTLLILVFGVVLFGAAAMFMGPVTSGGLFLLWPNRAAATPHDLPANYQPLHKGSVDLATGLYIRENEDIVINGTPALILRRTYLSRDRRSRRFGIGTTHEGEEFLVGDRAGFQWVSLILARGSAVRFRRTSPGPSYMNAMFVHEEATSEWQGARLGWTGRNWAVRKRDGSLTVLRSCDGSEDVGNTCSVIRSRDADGHTIHYRRDGRGALLRMDDGGERWITFEYDDSGRIVRALGSTTREVRYEYDSRGRLTRAASNDGRTYRYTYTDLDELATIEEPGTSIEQVYKDGRVVRQLNKYPDREPYVFDFTYDTDKGAVVRTDTKRSDGSWTSYTWKDGRTATETLGGEGYDPAVFSYERDPRTQAVTSLTLTCPDRTGRPLRHSSLVRPGHEERIKQDLLRTHCYFNPRRMRQPPRTEE